MIDDLLSRILDRSLDRPANWQNSPALTGQVAAFVNLEPASVWCLEAKLQRIDMSDDEELKNEILSIFQGLSSDKLKKSFDPSVERCQWAPANARNYYPS
jgi:hypothetical protein